MQMRSLTYDEDEGRYNMEYTFDPESYRRRGHGWHLLAEDLSSPDDEPDRRPELEARKLRRIVGGSKGSGPSDRNTKGSLVATYEQLLKKLLDKGTPVREFFLPPFGHAYAILRDPRPENLRNTDHLMLSVPGMRPDNELPLPTDFDESEVEIFEIYPEDLNRPPYFCLATSRDGVDWEKPELGRVEFHGSKTNNILGTIESVIRSADYKDVTASVTLGVTTPKFRFQDLRS